MADDDQNQEEAAVEATEAEPEEATADAAERAEEEQAEAAPPDEPETPPTEVRFLDEETLTFRRNAGRLELEGPADKPWRPVALAHLFPFTEPEAWLSVQDEKGREIGILRTLANLDEASLATLREALRRRFVVPRIQRVLACRERADLLEWRVMTDRGEATFVTRGLRDKAQSPTPGRYLLSDVEGNRYEVPNLAALDPESRARLEAHL